MVWRHRDNDTSIDGPNLLFARGSKRDARSQNTRASRRAIETYDRYFNSPKCGCKSLSRRVIHKRNKTTPAGAPSPRVRAMEIRLIRTREPSFRRAFARNRYRVSRYIARASARFDTWTGFRKRSWTSRSTARIRAVRISNVRSHERLETACV